MKQTWRWFGPKDKVTQNDMRQAGVEGVVSALHHLPNGTIWSVEEIYARQQAISQTPDGTPSMLSWDVVESLPVSEEIKQQRGDWRTHIENYKTSIRNLAACGIDVVCYNFMPILDWTRTDLRYELSNGARCMRFDLIDFAVFDIQILGRIEAQVDYPDCVVEDSLRRYETLSNSDQSRLVDNILCGLPGAEQGYTLSNLNEHLDLYSQITDRVLRKHQLDFLAEIIPIAEEVGVKMCCHPDDPPFSLLGLPRIMSTEDDYRLLTESIDSLANGITLCSGSLGVRADNDLPGMMNRLGEKVHFIHLRNVKRESQGSKLSFHEAAHLEGVTDMVALIQAILDEESRRLEVNRPDHNIPFRPDHGQDILSDLQAHAQPGYPAVGRLKGLAELRGIMTALSHPQVVKS